MMTKMMSSSFSLTQNAKTFLTRREETVVVDVVKVVKVVVARRVVDDDFFSVFFDDDDFWQSHLSRVEFFFATHARAHALSLSHMCVSFLSSTQKKSDQRKKSAFFVSFLHRRFFGTIRKCLRCRFHLIRLQKLSPKQSSTPYT